MKIKCSYSDLLAINDPKIIPNPDNPNDHSNEQIEQLAKILNYQGQRKPIIISKESGFIVTGHGTLMAAKKAGAKEIAVDFQSFESPAQEYAHVVADNGMQLQSYLDKAKINAQIVDLGPDFDIEMLGLDDFKVDVAEIDMPDLQDKEQPTIGQLAFMVSDMQREVINDALANVIANEELDLLDNTNKNAAALYILAQRYMSER